jgi:hypothetical protein
VEKTSRRTETREELRGGERGGKREGRSVILSIVLRNWDSRVVARFTREGIASKLVALLSSF